MNALESLRLQLRSYETAYEEAKAKFIENAETNPAYAIEWANTVVKAQGSYEAAYELIGRGVYVTVEDVRDAVKDLSRRIRRSHGTSTSGLSNAVEYHKWEAAVSVLERLESFLDYADRDAAKAVAEAV